ncbi:MAG: mechanosensitive ion channel family protein [Clostridia bacterium]|nr:mechanosensitive ion channel family protein [Clostridia bacterium]
MTEKLKQQNEQVKKKVKSLGPLKVFILLIMAVGTVCSYVFHDFIFAEDSIFYSGITSSQLLNSLLAIVPKVIQAIRIVTIVLIITTIVIAIINKVFKRTQREITVARLITNLLKWVVTIILIIAVLAVWGIDTTALITGAGVITLIVGLGMQSLIADIVAGLFIVFENEFNVGDIITIDDFRGTVLSIGIRTTKLEAVGNIKIINNSDIRGVLNQTVKPSTAKSLIDIEYGESLERVEGIIKAKLPDIKIDGIIGDISYDGVSALGASGVTLQFTAKCYEGDIFGVQREMNKRLKMMFDENSIGIPFPQVVVHTAEESKPVEEQKKPARKTVKKTNKEQK